MLVYFGGIQTPNGNSTWTGVPMSVSEATCHRNND
jgi:hypothetical protein